MTQKELIKMVAEKTDLAQTDIQEILAAIVASIFVGLKTDEEVKISPELGKFIVRIRQPQAARTGHHPQTGQPIKIAAQPLKKVVAFKPSSRTLEILKTK